MLYSFCSVANCLDGKLPGGVLVRDAAGNLYGTTNEGGALAANGGSGAGTVFKVDTTGHETVLYSFCSAGLPNCTDGSFPANSSLVMDAAGNLYGTTSAGGAHGGGTVFMVSSLGSETVLYSFCSNSGCTDGGDPAAGVILAGLNMYGTTVSGGTHGFGTVFKVEVGGNETVLYDFCSEANCSDGASPFSGLMQDASGNLYGTTQGGGTGVHNPGGTVFKIDSSGHETVLYSFCSQGGDTCTDGGGPYNTPLVQDAMGNLYGTTRIGGAPGVYASDYASGAGTVFQVDLLGNETVLHSFGSTYADGLFPQGGLVMDAAGNLYGTTTGGGYSITSGYVNDGTIFGVATTASGAANLLGELLGQCCTTPGEPIVGQPITVSTGNMFEQAADYTTAGQNPLTFTRYYNSQGNTAPVATLASSLGVNWRSTYDRYLNLATAGTVTAERADGQQLTFRPNGGGWISNTDVDVMLTNAGATWTLTDRNDTIETYFAISATEAQLQSITARNGYTQTLSYNGDQQFSSVSDSYGRTLSFTYLGNGLLHTLTTPDGTTVTYGYTGSGGSSVLATATYSTISAATITYLYQSGSFPFALTGIIDEDGNHYATWTYDSSGRALTSQLGAGANLISMVYNADGSRTVTNALGVTDTYKFTTLQGVPKVTEIDRAATATTAAATELFTYDGNGYTASQTDWNGDQTTYVNDVHGQPTTINEAVGTPVARTTTITYDDPTFVHLPQQIVTPGLTANFTYDGSGELLTRTLTDTTATTVPYSTNGQTRTWTNTWSNFLLASTKTPNGNT